MQARGVALILVAVLMGCSAIAARASHNGKPIKGQQPPSIVLIVLDDFGWTEMNAAPKLEQWAQENALTFRQAYSWPTCSPTRYAYRFGRYPRTQATVGGVGGIGDLQFNANNSQGERLPLEAISLYEAFRPTHSTALVGKWHLGRAPVIPDRIHSGPAWQGLGLNWSAGTATVISTGATGYYSWNRADGDRHATAIVYATDAQADAFLYLWGLPEPRPRFVELSFSAPHEPWDKSPSPGLPFTDREKYEDVIAYADKRLEDVLSAIDLQHTYVIVTSDNGTADAGRPDGTPSGYWKGSPYQGGINVPLFVAGPGITPGETNRLVSLIDLPATVLALAGIEPAAGFEHSTSFADELGGFSGTERDFLFSERYEVVSSSSYPQPAGFDCQVIVERELVSGVQLKRIIQDADGNGPGVATDTVYNLLVDPFEQAGIDFHTLPPGIRARLDAELATIPARL